MLSSHPDFFEKFVARSPPWVEEVRAKIDLAAEQLDRGEGIDGETVIAQLRAKLHNARET